MSIKFETAYRKLDRKKEETERLTDFVEQFSNQFDSENSKSHFIASWRWNVQQYVWSGEQSIKSLLKEVYCSIHRQTHC